MSPIKYRTFTPIFPRTAYIMTTNQSVCAGHKVDAQKLDFFWQTSDGKYRLFIGRISWRTRSDFHSDFFLL